MEPRSKRRPVLRLVGAFALTTLVTTACASLGTPEDQAHVEELWTSIEGYQEWPQFDGFEGITFGDTVHGDWVQVWVNDVGAADPQGLPYGTIVVKEGYDDEAGTKKRNITVMERIEGYDPENGDWFYAQYNKKGTPGAAGKVGFCIDCHDDVPDYIFFNE